jgi:putative intracellular protease/amidase
LQRYADIHRRFSASGIKERTMKILMVLTSHDRLGDTGKKTGFWLEEFAAPYYIFKNADADLTLASPRVGNHRSIREASFHPRKPRQPVASSMTSTLKPCWRTPRCWLVSKRATMTPFFIRAVMARSGISPASRSRVSVMGLRRCATPKAPDGKPLVADKAVTGFSNTEEEAVGLTHVVPFLVEDMLWNHGGNSSKKANWQPYAVADGDLITGQNPASSDGTAKRAAPPAALSWRIRPHRAQKHGRAHRLIAKVSNVPPEQSLRINRKDSKGAQSWQRTPSRGLNVAIMVTDGFEHVELTEPRKALDDAGATTKIVSPRHDRVRAWNFTDQSVELPVDVTLDLAKPEQFDVLLLPGGVLNPDSLRMQPKEGGCVRESVLRRRQAGRCDLPWSLDGHRDRRGARPPHDLMALAEDRPQERRRGLGGPGSGRGQRPAHKPQSR